MPNAKPSNSIGSTSSSACVSTTIWWFSRRRNTPISSCKSSATSGPSIAQIQTDALTQQFSFIKLAKTKEQAYTASIADKALSMWSGQSKKIFNLNKALSLAQTAVALPAAVLESYKNAGGYPFGIPAAAAMAAVGLAQINAIKNAKFGGGSSPPVTGAAAAGGGVVGDENAPGSTVGSNTQPTQARLILPENGIILGRALIDLINEATKDGAVIVGVN